jgi:hypothetical protein
MRTVMAVLVTVIHVFRAIANKLVDERSSPAVTTEW